MHVIIWQSVTLKGFQGLVSSLFEKKAILKQFVRLVEKMCQKYFDQIVRTIVGGDPLHRQKLSIICLCRKQNVILYKNVFLPASMLLSKS